MRSRRPSVPPHPGRRQGRSPRRALQQTPAVALRSKRNRCSLPAAPRRYPRPYRRRLLSNKHRNRPPSATRPFWRWLPVRRCRSPWRRFRRLRHRPLRLLPPPRQRPSPKSRRRMWQLSRAPPSRGSCRPPPLPAAIGSKGLIAAAMAGDPGASYEIATRLAEGRNVPVDLLALRDLVRSRGARRPGSGPVRLGSMYEKGLGVTRTCKRRVVCISPRPIRGTRRRCTILRCSMRKAWTESRTMPLRPNGSARPRPRHRGQPVQPRDHVCARHQGSCEPCRSLQVVCARRQGRRQGCRPQTR